MYTIRPAERADDPAIRGIIREARLNPTGLDWRRFFVAITPGGELIGCGQLKPHRDGSCELASIAVAPAWRGRGVAREIITALLASHQGPAYLTCRASLESFYAQFGFQVIPEPEMPAYFRRISKLFGLLRLFRLVREALLVMRRETLDNQQMKYRVTDIAT